MIDATRYTRLSGVNQRRKFDPKSSIDVSEFQYYIKNGKWKDKCPFFVEYPWEDIPAMCKDKFISHTFNQE